MRRCSFAWDSHRSAMIEIISSSDSDDEDCVLRRRPARKSGNCAGDTIRRNRFLISSDESSDSDVEIIISDDDVEKIATPRKPLGLVLPLFSYDTPDEKLAFKTNKLLRNISNICGTSFKSKTKLSDAPTVKSSKEDETGKVTKANDKKSQSKDSTKRSSEVKKIDSELLFDQLLGLSSPDDGLVTDRDRTIVEAQQVAERKKPPSPKKVPAAQEILFKVPKNNVYKKQKEISNRMKNPADSKIVFKRSDDSDSSTTCSSRENLDKLCRLPELDDLFGASAAPQGDVKSDDDDNGEFHTKPRSPPVRRKRGKAKEFNFSDWQDVLDEIGEQECNKNDYELGFIGSLDDTIHGHGSHAKAKLFKDNFVKEKENLTKLLFRIFNEKAFDGQLPPDMKIEWSGRLTTSAGITHMSRKYVTSEYHHQSSITLSKAIVTTTARLRDTLIHEMCHAAVWLIDRKKDGHGPYWKAWTKRARMAFPDLKPIGTTHTYSRAFKFNWECMECGYTIGRMSKSFDTEKFRCGRCRGRFVLKEDPSKLNRKPRINVFANFVKENYASVKKSNPSSTHKEIMKLISQLYKDQNKLTNNNDQDDIDDDNDIVCLD